MSFSQLDSSIALSDEQWAVTMIRKRRNNHAMLIVEGTTNNVVFKKMGHLTGALSWVRGDCAQNGSKCLYSRQGIVRTKDWSKIEIEYGSKSETWTVSRDKAEKMWARIILEEQDYTLNQGKIPQPFSILGNRSIFSSDYKSYEISNRELEGLLKDNPNMFEEVVEMSQQPTETMESTIDRYKNKRRFEVATYGTSFLLVDGIYKLIVYCKDQEKQELEKIKRLIKLAKEYVREHVLRPNNCFTWAREKLRMVDVHMKEKPIDKLVSMTSFYCKSNR